MAVSPSSLPLTMRAWTRPSRGSYRTNLHLTAIPTPSPPVGTEVLIKVSYVGLNPGGLHIMALIPAFLTARDFTPEFECSGTVVAAGPEVPAELRQPGTPVVAFRDLLSGIRGKGVLCEYVKIPAENSVIRVPEGLKGRMDEIAAIMLVAQTGIKMIKTAGVKAGDVVLVNGASGGVGVMAVQLCKWKGARVVGVASGGNEELVRGVGADEFIDYRKQKDLPGYLKERFGKEKLDHVLDCVGTQALYANSPSYLKVDGWVVNIGAFEGIWRQNWNWMMNAWCPTWLGGTPRRYAMFSTPPMRDVGVEVVKLMDEGKVRVPIDGEWKFEDVIEAYDRIDSKRTRGKIVIAV